MEDINKLSKKLYKEVLDEYNNQGDAATRKSLGELLDEKLTDYNDATKEIIETKVFDAVGGVTAFKSLPNTVLSGVKLSDTLYKNSDQVARETVEILNSSIKAQNTIKKMSMKLYNGYDFKDKEVLSVVKKLPKYLQRELRSGKVSEELIRYVDNIKTKPYRTALNQIITQIDKSNEKGLQKALKVVLEEKSRYYATRIAVTESHRARNLSRAKDFLEDKDVQFVKFTMSSRHPMIDICDYYANLDVGFGKGVVPVDKMITIPLHPGCFCTYKQHPYTPTKKQINNPEANTMNKFSLRDQQNIVGSFDKLKEFKNGKPLIKIFNAARPKYPIEKYSDVFKLHKKSIAVATKPKVEDIKFGYGGKFDGYVKDIRDEAKIVINKLPKPNIIKKSKNGVYYSETSEINTTDKKSTFLHEYGHHIDTEIGVLNTTDPNFNKYNKRPEFSSGHSNRVITSKFNQAYDDDIKFLNLRSTKTKHEVMKGFKDSWYHEEKKRVLTYNVANKEYFERFSDIVDSLTKGSFQKNYYVHGHGVRYYKRISARNQENFANLFYLWSQGGNIWEETKQLFPNLSREFEEVMKGVIDAKFN